MSIPRSRVYLDPGDSWTGPYDPPRECRVLDQWGPVGTPPAGAWRGRPVAKAGPRNVLVRYADDDSLVIIPFGRRLRRKDRGDTMPRKTLAERAGKTAETGKELVPTRIIPPGERPPEAEARERTDRIKAGLPGLRQTTADIIAAIDQEDWRTLGYESSEAWATEEFGSLPRLSRNDRNQLILEMVDAGATQREAAAVAGVDHTTVGRTVAKAGAPAPEDTGPAPETPAPKTTGTRQVPKPEPPDTSATSAAGYDYDELVRCGAGTNQARDPVFLEELTKVCDERKVDKRTKRRAQASREFALGNAITKAARLTRLRKATGAQAKRAEKRAAERPGILEAANELTAEGITVFSAEQLVARTGREMASIRSMASNLCKGIPPSLCCNEERGVLQRYWLPETPPPEPVTEPTAGFKECTSRVEGRPCRGAVRPGDAQCWSHLPKDVKAARSAVRKELPGVETNLRWVDDYLALVGVGLRNITTSPAVAAIVIADLTAQISTANGYISALRNATAAD